MKIFGPQKSTWTFAGVLPWIAVWLLGAGSIPAASQVTAVSTQLLRPVRSTALHEGDTVFVQTTERWQEADCRIAEGTEILGRVVSVTQDAGNARKGSFALRFAPVACAGPPEKRMIPVLVAIQGPKPPAVSALSRLATAQLEDQTIASMFSPPRPGVPTSADTMLTSAHAVPVINWEGLRPGDDGDVPKTGEVSGVRGLRLELPSTEPATTLVYSRPLTLQDREANLLLALVPDRSLMADRSPRVPATGAVSGTLRADANGKPSSSRAVAPTEREVCAAGGCTQLTAATGVAGGDALWSVPLGQLGFKARPQQPLHALDDGASVHFLGQDEILLTFPLHILVRRTGRSTAETNPRRVRGVLLARGDGRVLKVMDWDVPDSAGAYVWTLRADRLLVQQGEELVCYGPGWVALERVPLAGAVAFVSVAPEGDALLLATMHEKHGLAEHEALRKFLGPDEPIEENYDVTALNGQLEVVSTRMLYARPLQPALLRGGMVTAEQGAAGHWQLVRTTWTGSRNVIARVASTCPVRVRSMPPNGVLVQGCIPDQLHGTWYRLLNDAGATVLKGEHDRNALMEQGVMDAGGKEFAVSSLQEKEAIDFALPVRAGTFDNMDVEVHDARTGKVLFARHLSAGSPEKESVALSPAGNAVVVFTTEGVQAWQLPS